MYPHECRGLINHRTSQGLVMPCRLPFHSPILARRAWSSNKRSLGTSQSDEFAAYTNTKPRRINSSPILTPPGVKMLATSRPYRSTLIAWIVIGVWLGKSPLNVFLAIRPWGVWPISGASMQAKRIMVCLPWILAITRSPSITRSRVEACTYKGQKTTVSIPIAILSLIINLFSTSWIPGSYLVLRWLRQ